MMVQIPELSYLSQLSHHLLVSENGNQSHRI
jgi:hypothetical protein